MKKYIHALFISLGLLGCSASEEETAVLPLGKADIPSTAAVRATPCSETDSFAVQLFSVLAASQEDNFVFSPASLEAVLRLLQQGARGATAAELAALPMGKTGIRSAMNPNEACALFVDNHITLNKDVKVDEIRRAPFAANPSAAAGIINSWAKHKTQGLISSVISERDISPNTGLVAANAIYLKERWLHPFPKNATREETPFTTDSGDSVPVAMMRCSASFRYAEGDNWTAVALPYRTDGRKGEPGYFIGILPNNNARDFVRNLTPVLYRNILRALADNAERKTVVLLPRMKLDPGTYSLKPALLACGLKNIFSGGADFSGFCRHPLYLSDVLQRCFVKADEEGTEAAAVTVAVARCKAIPPGPLPKVICFDKPFIWIIGDLNTPAAPYFMGITQKPN